MTFTLTGLVDSLAAVLKASYPHYPVYAGPNQQGTEVPCFFVLFMPSELKNQVNDRFLEDLGVDIVFLQERNAINGNLEIISIVDCLNTILPLFPYKDGEEVTMIHTFERQWHTEDQELHYQFRIKQRVSLPRNEVTMEIMEDNHARIKEK